MSLHPALTLLIATHLMVTSTTPASAQVTGRVTDGSTGEPVAGAMISLLDGSRDVVRRSVSDSAGRYTVQAPEPGDYWLTADFLGYERLESPLLALDRERAVAVDFELPVDAIELEGLRVEAERNEELRRRVRLYGVRPEELRDRWVDREQIERWQAAPDFGVAVAAQGIAGVTVRRNHERVGRTPRICVRVRSPGCALVVWNGQPVSNETAALIPPMSLEAIVLLRPTEATLSYGTAGGNGAVLLFTLGSSGRQ